MPSWTRPRGDHVYLAGELRVREAATGCHVHQRLAVGEPGDGPIEVRADCVAEQRKLRDSTVITENLRHRLTVVPRAQWDLEKQTW